MPEHASNDGGGEGSIIIESEDVVRILHLEDNSADAELIAAILRAAGKSWEIVRAASPDAFARFLASESFDVVLSDYTMPSFDGLAALALVRETLPDVPFILVSGTVGEKRAIEAVGRGVTDFVLKEQLGRLVPAIRRALLEVRARLAHRAAEEALVESERWLRETQQIAHVGSWAWNMGTSKIVWSDELYRIHGLPPHPPVAPASLLDRVHPEDQARVAAIIEEALGSHEPVEYEFRILREDQSVRHVRAYGQVQTDESGKPIRMVGATQDITANRLLEEQFRQAQKMEAIGQLAGGIAHDFNNLLGVISGYADLVRKEIGPEHSGQRRLAQILRAADSAAGLTRQLMTFSRKQSVELVELELNAVVVDIDNMLRRLIGEHIQLVAHLSPKLGKVRADSGQLQQVLMNLAVNARDAMPRGGKLLIETTNAILDRSYVQTHADVRSGPYVVLSVSDTGHGMDAETVSHIFEPFFTTKEPGKGTGLGLATVYGIVKQSEGLLHVYSEPGRGTTFKVYLPRVDAAPAASPVGPESAPRGSETVLLADDDPALRILIREALQEAGYRVIDARNAEEAVDRLTTHEGPLHVLVSDIVMPPMTGKQLAVQVTARWPACRVLYMSGYPRGILDHQGLSEPDAYFIEKPFTMNALVRRLREVLDETPTQ